MFRRLIPESSSATLMLIAFVVAAAIFLYIVYRALTMRKKDVERIANMPLGEEPVRRADEDKPGKDGMLNVEADIADGSSASAERNQAQGNDDRHGGKG